MMQFKLLLALALLGAAHAGDYEYNNGNQKEQQAKSKTSANDINQREQQTASSNEEYVTSYNSDNAQATPDGYDYLVPARTRQFAAGGLRSASNSGGSSASSSSNAASIRASNLLRNAATVAAATSTGALLSLPLPVLRQREPEFYPPANYDFSYAVHDESTGDIKEHSETRDGYVVRGSYSLIDPDGYKRTVTYTADDVHGFNAVVNRVPYALKTVAVAPVAAAPLSVSNVSLLKGVGVAVQQSNELQHSHDYSSAGGSATSSEDSYVTAAHERHSEGGPYA